MCGRYLLRNAPSNVDMTWREYYERIEFQFDRPRYNICPSQQAPVLRMINGEPGCDLLTWGFKPAWSKFQPLINARAEGLLESKMFKPSILNKRCLVIADGFYEPEGPSSQKKRPWHVFQFADQQAFAMAGIWTDDGFAIITNEANKQVRDIHNRMPHILEAKHWPQWLDRNMKDEKEIHCLLQAKDYTDLSHHRVGDYVKKPGNEGAQCTERKR